MKNKIIEIVQDNGSVTIEEKDLDTSLDDLGLDSLDISCIAIDIETKLEMELDEDSYSKNSTINDLIKLVEDAKCKN